ncbi:MAG: nucleotidyltransferase domain-containing protein, partial [Candidatus Nanohalobium sp.]
MPLTSKQEDALNLILDRLSEVDCDWALTGGVSFILQGVDYETSDIDIQTSKEGAQKIMDELSDFVEEELYYRESEKMKSY